jgi:hypothetical protein
LSRFSHAEGSGSYVDLNADGSHAEGNNTHAENFYAHSEGDGTTASVVGSHSEGSNSLASGDYAHAEGYYSCIASASGSHAEGGGNEASGESSHAEGSSTIASGLGSHAEGFGTIASGLGSHAEGLVTVAFGSGSFSAGWGTISSGSVDGGGITIPQAALGKFNLPDNTSSLLVVGDGIDDATRHDILRVEPGSVQISGTLYVSGAADNLPYVIVKGPTNSLSLNVGSTSKNSSINGIGSGYEGFGAGGVDIVSEYGVSLGSSDAPILGVKPTSNGSSFSAILVSPFFLASHGATTVDGNAGYITLNAGEQSVTVTNRCLLSGYSGNSPSIVFVSVATDDATLKSAIGINNRNGTMTIKGNAAATGVVHINFFILGPITSGPIS